jgi:hypothetical protein
MTRSYKKTIDNLQESETNYTPRWISKYWFTSEELMKYTHRVYKRNVFTSTAGKKKRGKFLVPKQKGSIMTECEKHNLTRCMCDWAEKYVPSSKTNIKYKLVSTSVREMSDTLLDTSLDTSSETASDD